MMSYFPYNIVGTLEVIYSNGSKEYGTGWLFGLNDVSTSLLHIYRKIKITWKKTVLVLQIKLIK